MLELLQFIFQSFWHFAGTVILLYVAALPVIALCGFAVEAFARNKH